jgi:exopolysaccharide production protein ExoZ
MGIVLTVTGLALFASGFWLDYERLPSVASWGVPSLFLVAGALAFEPYLRSVPGRRLAKLGDSSYLLYLSHILILDLLMATPIAALDSGEQAAILLSIPLAAACLVVAALGYEIVELPLLKVMRRLFQRRSRRDLRPFPAAQ